MEGSFIHSLYTLTQQANLLELYSIQFVSIFLWLCFYTIWVYFYVELSSKYFRTFSLFFILLFIAHSTFIIFKKEIFILVVQIFLLGLPFFVLGKILRYEKKKRKQEYNNILKENKIIRLDLRLAKTIQEALFPKLEPIHGLQYDVYRQSQSHIGGDFFDFVKLREGNIGIFMTDVAGHGISAAMVASMIKVLVSTIPYVYKQDPSALLTYIDNKMSSDFKSEHATAVYIFINFQTKTIHLANAGHPYVIYQKKGEEFKEIETEGALLGYGIQSPIALNYSFSYFSGDRFVVYTDGLIEDFNSKGEYLGPEGLLNILNKLKHEPTSSFKEKLILEIYNFYQKTIFTDDAMFMIFELD